MLNTWKKCLHMMRNKGGGGVGSLLMDSMIISTFLLYYLFGFLTRT